MDHRIPTGDAKPIKMADRSRTPHQHEIIDKFIADGFAEGIIEPAHGPSWASALHVVRKKDNTYRPCVDYRRVNDVTIKDVYPLVRIGDCHHFLQGANFFTTLDLKSGYWQLRVAPEDRDKTTFTSRSGLYRFW